MASIKNIQRRIKSAKNISQITKAMEMVAASKMKKSQNIALQGKPYFDAIYNVTRELAQHTEREEHPLLSMGAETSGKLVILISTNKGLCGGLNTNLFKEMHKWFPVSEKTEYMTIGKKGQHFVVNSGRNLVLDFSQREETQDFLPALVSAASGGFIEGKYAQVYLVFNTFINSLKQEPAKRMILPLTELRELAGEDTDQSGRPFSYEFKIEPGINEVLDDLLIHYIQNQIRSALSEAEASEHSARMMAMKNATEAARDLMDYLTLLFNKARQEKITYEIADMVTARLAVS